MPDRVFAPADPGRSMNIKFLFGALLLAWTNLAYPAPVVVASIKPVHSIVSAVMSGVDKPALLLEANVSPHHYSLKPSDARTLGSADLVFWVGPELETFLVKPIATLARQARSVTLLDNKLITVYPLRGPEGHHEHGTGNRDPHIWLDPVNAIAIARVVADTLSAMDEGQAQRYRSNLAEFESKLRELDTTISTMMAPVRSRSYVVTHDAFQYFERRYRLDQVIHLSYVPAVLPGARRISEARADIARRNARCVFTEPQLGGSWAPVLEDGYTLRSGVLDPLGINVPAGSDGYEQLLLNIARSLVDCLSAQ